MEEIKYFNPLFKNFTDEDLQKAFDMKKRRLGISNLLGAMVIEINNRAIFKATNYNGI